MNLDLFDSTEFKQPDVQLGSHAVILRSFALADAAQLLSDIRLITATAALRNMVTPNGHTMSVAVTNCGSLGWTSDRHGYRYTPRDPITNAAWPTLPPSFITLAQRAASTAGFDNFQPDACLINRYLPGTRMGLHQDKNERHFDAPIVSVSLGISATFLFGGMSRTAPVQRAALFHGDVAVWGGPDRLRYHGVAPLPATAHPLVGMQRFNLTFRRAG